MYEAISVECSMNNGYIVKTETESLIQKIGLIGFEFNPIYNSIPYQSMFSYRSSDSKAVSGVKILPFRNKKTRDNWKNSKSIYVRQTGYILVISRT